MHLFIKIRVVVQASRLIYVPVSRHENHLKVIRVDLLNLVGMSRKNICREIVFIIDDGASASPRPPCRLRG